jgi:isopenicillin-N epimerase
MPSLKDHFLLDPDVIFLNHGSFGATPRPVFETHIAWQRLLERQPVKFLARRAVSLMASARQSLAEYLGVGAEDLVYFPNPTTAINMVARSLVQARHDQSQIPGRPILNPGDEILTTNHEYGAMDRTWRYYCKRAGARYVQMEIPIPFQDNQEFIDKFWAGVNDRTRIIFLSHLTSPTAIITPVKEICQRAREAGVLSIIDGAHAVGQVSLDLLDVKADIYTGACHKWLCAPKGSAFLYVRKDHQDWLDPLVISWGYQPDPGYGSGVQFIDYHEWGGTRDISPFLSTPAAIEFQSEHEWGEVQERCHTLAAETLRRLNAITVQPAICGEDKFRQMVAIKLPEKTDPQYLKSRLYDDFSIEVPVYEWNRGILLRASFQGYNDQRDADALVQALKIILAK